MILFYTRYRVFTFILLVYYNHFDCGIAARMAEEAEAIVANETNITEPLSGRDAATSEGLLLAYGSLLVMALIPIYLGARRSVYFHENLKVTIAIIRTYPDNLRRY